MKHKEPRKQCDETLYAEELHDLADTISEVKNASKTCSPLDDPFDEYFSLMSSKIFMDSHGFRTRFIKGYHTLFHFLEHQDHSETKSDT